MRLMIIRMSPGIFPRGGIVRQRWIVVLRRWKKKKMKKVVLGDVGQGKRAEMQGLRFGEFI